MTQDSQNETDSPGHGHSGEGAASIVPHLPGERQQQSQLPTREDSPAAAQGDGDAPG